MLENEFLLEAHFTLAPAIDAGPGPTGFRRVIPITGGTFEGPKLKGRVVPGGDDRQLFRPDGVLEVVARYELETDDSSILLVTNRGYWDGSPEIGQRIMSGETVDPSLYYFRTCARIEAAVGGPHAWLNRKLIIGTAAPTPGAVAVKFFVVT